MKPASQLLIPAQRTSVEQAVRDVEKNSSAEIVVVLATRSGGYDRAEDTFAIILALFVTSAVWVFAQRIDPSWGNDSQWTLALGLVPLLAVFVITTILGATLATNFPLLARAFIPRQMMLDETYRAAADAFHRFRVRSTSESTGVLIYVSLFERLVLILPDDRIGSAVRDETWSPARDAVIDGFRSGKIADGLRDAVLAVGRIVEQHAPPNRAANPNELDDSIRFLD